MAKAKADNTTAKKLNEAKAGIPDSFNAIPVLDDTGKPVKDKATKKPITMKWLDIFTQADTTSDTHDKFKELRDKYKAESSSISQLMLMLARVAKSQDTFKPFLKNMYIVYKTTNNKKIPQSIYDAASIINRAWRHGIDPCKATSVEVLKKSISERAKQEQNAHSISVDDSTLAATMKELAAVGARVKADFGDAKLDQFINDVAALGTKYLKEAETLATTSADDKKATTAKATKKAA